MVSCTRSHVNSIKVGGEEVSVSVGLDIRSDFTNATVFNVFDHEPVSRFIVTLVFLVS